jgi:hypothetical protein
MKRIICIFLCLAFVLVWRGSYAQQDLTMYSCSAIPQSNFTNPILFPDVKFHLGLPIISSIYIGAGHSGFHLHNILNVVDTSLLINGNKLVNNLPKRSFVNITSSIDLLSFGFKVGKNHYVNFGASNKLNTRLGYPRNLIDFLNRASQSLSDADIDFTKTGLYYTLYNEYLIGYTFQLNEKFTFGAHAKYLQGLANINIRKSDVSLYTEIENDFITIAADIDAYASMPENVWDKSKNASVKDYAMQWKNKGLALDFGSSYNITERLSVGASVIDLGFINWTAGTRRFRSVNPDGEFTFQGADFSEFFFGKEGDTTTLIDRVNQLIDTLSSIFQVDTLYETYTTPLNTYLNFHLFYDINKNNRLSALVRTQFFLEALHASLSLGYTRNFGKILTLAGTYSISSRKYDNFGFVFALRLGSTQFYITTDNLPIIMKRFKWGENHENTFIVPKNTKYFNIHFGMNLVFGHKSSYD